MTALRMAGVSLLVASCVGAKSGKIPSGGSDASAASDLGAREAGLLPGSMFIPGFDLQPRQGGWWKFGSSWDWNGGGAYHHDAKFLLTLGAPTTIKGDQAFPVTLTLLEGNGAEVSFPWKYLSFTGQRIRGSKDGTELTTLFDANTGQWPAANDGLWNSLRHGKYLYRAMIAPVADHDPFLTGTAWRVTGVSQAGPGCMVVPGYPDVCDTDPYPPSYLGADYFREGVGMVGTYFQGCTQGCITQYVGLLDSSLSGDRPPPVPGASDAGVVPAADGGPPADTAAPAADTAPAGCVDFQNTVSGVPVIAATGTAPAATGGTIADGLYVSTAVKVYGSAAAPGTQLGAFGGVLRFAAPIVQVSFGGSSVASFYGKGTFTISGSSVDVNYTCSSTGPLASSFAFSSTPAGGLEITTISNGYPSVVTYARQ